MTGPMFSHDFGGRTHRAIDWPSTNGASVMHTQRWMASDEEDGGSCGQREAGQYREDITTCE